MEKSWHLLNRTRNCFARYFACDPLLVAGRNRARASAASMGELRQRPVFSPQNKKSQFPLPTSASHAQQIHALDQGSALISHVMTTHKIYTAIVFLVSLCIFASTSTAQTRDIPKEHNGWGRFAPGAWQTARIITESFDDEGNPTGTTTTVERIALQRSRRGYATLRIESVLEVGGKKFDSPVRTISVGYHGEEIGNRTLMQEIGPEETKVEGEPIPCRVRQYEIESPGQHKLVKIHYSKETPPYLLRRETVTTLGEDEEPAYRNQVEVTALDRPYPVLDEIKKTSHQKMVKTNGKSAITKWSIHAADIPGEVVSYRSEEKNNQGQLIRRSTMELMDYGYDAPFDEIEEVEQKVRRRDKRRSRRRG